jgi:REP element-mobilizing transposase RayT
MTTVDLGFYFITTVTWGRLPLLAWRSGLNVKLTGFGRIVQVCWIEIPDHFPQVRLDAYVIMPDHFHGLLEMLEWSACGFQRKRYQADPCSHEAVRGISGTLTGSLGAIIGGFKSASTRRINRARGRVGEPVWQPSFHDHVVRSVTELERIRRYIESNPARP